MIIIYPNFSELKNKSDEIIKRGWIECSNHSSGSAGLLLERLLGLENHNFCFPDFDGIEIKTKFTNSISKMTMFNATPDGYLFSTKKLHETYGYPDRNNKNFKVFHMSFSANQMTYINKNNYGKLQVDRDHNQIVLKIYDRDCNVIDEDISWSFDLLKDRLNIKLKYLCIMYVKRAKFQEKFYCNFLYYNFFCYKGFEQFLTAVEKGYVKITFSIDIFKSGKRAGNVHDHGTSFDIDIQHIQEIFEPIKVSEN